MGVPSLPRKASWSDSHPLPNDLADGVRIPLSSRGEDDEHNESRQDLPSRHRQDLPSFSD
jgi:hypothetical protein